MKAKTKRIALCSSVGAILLIVMGVVTGVAESQSGNLDLIMPGEATVVGTGENLDTNYIDYKYDNQADALKNAQAVTQETAEEGITLLKNKNNALPLASTQKITILGYYSWHNNMSGGEDPATTNGAISLGTGLENAFDTNERVNDLYDAARGEIDTSALDGVSSTFSEYNTAVVTIKRNSGEGNDQSMNQGAAEFNRTGLSVNNAEYELIDYASKHFDKVILVINAANAMELGFLDENDPNYNAQTGMYTDPYSNKEYDFSKVEAALWAGCCGSQGGTALARILNGTVNPSGHLVDTYVRDLTKDPTYQNFGSYKYTNSSQLNTYQGETFFVEYEEGIYIGYRYYETAAYEADKGNYDTFDYEEEVVFPFGYGLSYTDFSLAYEGTPTYNEETGVYHFDVKITNTGTVAGKGVAQIYVNAPYVTGGVEKAHVVLGGFAKTSKALAGGESEVVGIDIHEDYFTSYDYEDEKCYILDAGTYNFYLSENAHSWATIDQEDATTKATHLWQHTIDSKIVFKDSEDGKRKTDLVEAVNVEDDELNYKFKDWDEGSTGDGFVHDFSREDFEASFPTAPTGQDWVLSDERAIKEVEIYDVWAEENQFITEDVEINVDKTSYGLIDMRGVDFDDPKWDDYINQFTLESMVNMFSNGGWQECADTEINPETGQTNRNGVPLSYDADSPYGYYAHALQIKNVNKWYCGAPMLAASFNTDLARKVGDAFAEEAHANQLAGGSLITGLYGYGANTHRSAFGGRNYEYYSEDPLLAGKFAAAESSAASEKGLITFMKHYTLNDQETNRQKNGYCAWCNEQAFREIYVKPWEIYSKEAKMNIKYWDTDAEGNYVQATKEMPAATGMMTAYNRIGATYAGASVSIKEILMDECGYVGSTITDAGGEPNTYMTTDYLLRRGGNLTLANNGSDGLYDTESNTAKYYLKQATKQTLYNKANSNCVVGIAPGDSIIYGLAPWRMIIYAAWGVIGAVVLADLVYIALVVAGKVNIKEKEMVTTAAGGDDDEF